MRKTIAIFFVFCLFVILSIDSSYAKLLPQAVGKKVVSSNKTSAVSSSVTVSPRLRADRKALLVSFGGLTSATSVSYTLTYNQNGQNEGAGGSITPDSATASRELLFGTCSSGVCRYHTNIKNMKFEVVSKLKSGKVVKRRFGIRV